RGGNAMVKRFTAGGTTRDKEYVLTKGNEGSKLLYFSISENPAEIIHVKLRPKPKLRKTEFEFDMNSIEVKGRGSIGNILSRNLVAKISRGAIGSQQPTVDSQQISTNEKSSLTVKRKESKIIDTKTKGSKKQ